jgi:hypothetical protein
MKEINKELVIDKTLVHMEKEFNCSETMALDLQLQLVRDLRRPLTNLFKHDLNNDLNNEIR